MNVNRVMKTGQSEPGGRFAAMFHRACTVIQSAGCRAAVESDPVDAGSADGRSQPCSQPLAVGQHPLLSENSHPLNQPLPARHWPLSPPRKWEGAPDVSHWYSGPHKGHNSGMV